MTGETVPLTAAEMTESVSELFIDAVYNNRNFVQETYADTYSRLLPRTRCIATYISKLATRPEVESAIAVFLELRDNFQDVSESADQLVLDLQTPPDTTRAA